MKFNLTHARHDPAHCLAPGLFRSLKKGERRTHKLDVVYEFGDGQRIEFSGPEPLGADDLRVLQGLVALAGPSGLVLSPEPKTDDGKQLRFSLETKWDAVKLDALVIRGSYRSLAKEIGYADIDNSRPIRDCIERLWKVSVIATFDKKRVGYRLLSEYACDNSDGRLFVALNPRITQAIIGNSQHTRISMDEVRALRSDVARLIHQRLCGWIDPGKSQRIHLDTLCGYVWLGEANTAAMQKRRQRVRTALHEIQTLGWIVNEYSIGKFEIRRKSHTGLTVSSPLRNCPDPPV